MHVLATKSEATEFKPWNSPHLLTYQFQLLAKFILALNANVPPEQNDVQAEMLKEYELKMIQLFSHQMMPSWLALAKSYYPFYKKNDSDKVLIEKLEQQLDIKATDYESLAVLIKKVFLAKYPEVNSQYQMLIDNMKTVMAKLTSVALSTPTLINQAHQYDNKKFEEAGPSMSNCIGPIETILRHLMGRVELDKSVVISASSLLLQVKAIKSYFEQLSLIQQLESSKKENKILQKQLENLERSNNDLAQNSEGFEDEQNKALQSWQSKEEQLALLKVFKLQKRINHYNAHLTEVLARATDKKAEEKLALITRLNTDLSKDAMLPSQRIELFENTLRDSKDQLKDHRDPMWMRFLKDCLRILALTFSGIALYRTLSGQAVNFFKPSHGQRFVEETNNILASPSETSLKF